MIMRKPSLKSVLTLVAAMLLSLSAFGQQRTTFCNPLDLIAGHDRAGRGGEPVVLLYQDDYYLFVTGRRGYWYSPDFQNWTYVEAPNFPGGVVSVVDIDGELIAVSQFTLTASTRKGNRPSYIRAAGHGLAIPLYERFCQLLSEAAGRPVRQGRFGADMKVGLINDGPVTIIIDSKLKE